ncbi:TPA: hypothetical protein HMT89_22465 [Escherichia coli]|nr:hypothetical protein [Escherichia coli]
MAAVALAAASLAFCAAVLIMGVFSLYHSRFSLCSLTICVRDFTVNSVPSSRSIVISSTAVSQLRIIFESADMRDISAVKRALNWVKSPS